MYLGSSQLFGPNHLASGHLHQRGPSQESLPLVLNEDGIVRQSGMICTSSRRRAEDDGAGRFSVLCADRQIAE